MVVSSGLHPGTTIAGYTPALIGVLPAESWQYLVRRSDLAHPLMVHAAPQRDRPHRLGAGNALVAELRIRLCNVAASYKSACVAIPAVIVIVIVINVLFAAHTHVSMARPSLAHSLVVYPRPVTCRCGVSGDTYHAPAFSTRQSPVSTLVYSPQGAHWHPAASVGCRWFWRAPGLY